MTSIARAAFMGSVALLGVLALSSPERASADATDHIWCKAYSSGDDSPRRIYYSGIFIGDYGADSQSLAYAFERHLEGRFGYAEVGGCFFAWPLERAREENAHMRRNEEIAGYAVVQTGWRP